MTRKELIAATLKELNAVAVDHAKVSPAVVERTVNAIFDKVIPRQLEEGNVVAINDFGKFEVNVREARKGRNPQTGAELEIGEKASVKFKASSALKARLN